MANENKNASGIVQNFKLVYQKNWRQITSISPGLVLLICSGVHILNVILEVRGHLLSDNKQQSSFFIYAAWFYGAPIGFILSGVDTQKLRKRNIYILCSLLLGISSALLIASEAKLGSANKYAVVGRVLAGITHGIVLHTVLIHSGEMGTRKTRRFIIRPIGFSILLGTALHYTIYRIFDRHGDHFVLPGIISLVLSVIALFLSFVFTYESVPWLIRIVNNIPLALQTWLVLQSESDANPQSQVVQNFLDLKQEIEEADRMSKNILTNRNATVLIKAVIIRILAAIVASPAVFALLTLAENKDSFPVSTGIIARVIFAIVFLYLFFESVSRNKDNIWAIFWLGVKLVILNICFILTWSNWATTVVWYFTLASFYIAPPIFDYTGHVYLSEVFPFPKKDWSLANVLIIEYIFHIVLIGIAVFIPLHNAHIELLTIGVVVLVLGLIVSRLVDGAELLRLREERVERALSAATTLRATTGVRA